MFNNERKDVFTPHFGNLVRQKSVYFSNNFLGGTTAFIVHTMSLCKVNV